MVSDKGKRFKVADSGEGEDSDHIDEELVVYIEKLQEVQDELEKINEEASDKLLEVEQQFNEIRRPVYSRRKDIIQSIPDFWLTAFLSHPILGDLINENDQKILKHLVSLDVEDSKDVKSGYSITFNFLPNPYFEDKKLTKTITFTDEATCNIIGTSIKWKEGMDIANKSSHETKGVKRPFEEDSFFNWFSETALKTASGGLTDEVAEIIKDDLWPNPLRFFNNEADEEELDGEDDDDDEKGSDFEDDEDEDEDEGVGQDDNAEED